MMSDHEIRRIAGDILLAVAGLSAVAFAFLLGCAVLEHLR